VVSDQETPVPTISYRVPERWNGGQLRISAKVASRVKDVVRHSPNRREALIGYVVEFLFLRTEPSGEPQQILGQDQLQLSAERIEVGLSE